MANDMTNPQNLGRLAPTGKRTAVAGVEVNADVAILEFQSPSIALISRSPGIYPFYTTWIVGGLLASLIVLAGTLPIDRVVTATGRVVPAAPSLLVQPLDVSVVRSIDVKVGQHVTKGQLLARLDPTFTGADLASLEKQNASLQAQVERLTDESNGRIYYNNSKPETQLQTAIAAQLRAQRTYTVESYNQKIASLRTQLAGDLTQVRNYTDRLGYAETALRAREELERQGVGARLNTLQARDTLAETRRLLEAIKSQAEADQKNVDQMIAERDSYVQQQRAQDSSDLHDATDKLNDAREQLKKAQLHRQLVDLRAEQDATVLAISNVSVGSVMSVGDPFITLVPDTTELEVDAIIDASEVSFVRPGDPAMIKFEAYTLYEHGYADGRVRTLGPDAQPLPSASQSSSGLQTMGSPGTPSPASAVDINSNTVYRVKISIDALRLTNLPSDFRLQPGLGVSADIKVGERTIMSYLFGRYLPALTEGMREP